MNTLNCPVCLSACAPPFIQIGGIPVYCNLLYKSRDEAERIQRADIDLGFCDECGHVFNAAFNPDLMDYTLDYENSLHFSPKFQRYAEDLAARLVERYTLKQQTIVDIGCGDGDFLELLCRDDNNRGFGFDPSHVPDLDASGADKGITFIRDYYSDKYAHYPADFVCCRHVLEHIQDPRDFMETIRKAIGGKKTVVFFEVPNVLYTLKDLGIWDLIYEHCSYFSPSSLITLFEKCGFRVLEHNETFQGQFLTIETVPSTEKTSEQAKLPLIGDLKSLVNEFRHNFEGKVAKWQTWLREAQKDHQRVVIWGAGSKGATFLNLTDIDNAVEFVVDINPRKHGNYIAGTAQTIVAPDHLIRYKPDSVIIMNPIYLSEISKMINQLGLQPEIIPV